MTVKAILNEKNVYEGYSKEGNGPEVPEGCDLAPGKYRWNPEMNVFEPLSGPKVSLELAFASLCEHVEKSTGTLPQEVQSWLKKFYG